MQKILNHAYNYIKLNRFSLRGSHFRRKTWIFQHTKHQQDYEVYWDARFPRRRMIWLRSESLVLRILCIVKNSDKLENTAFRELDLFPPSGDETPTLLDPLERAGLNNRNLWIRMWLRLLWDATSCSLVAHVPICRQDLLVLSSWRYGVGWTDVTQGRD
jgi:hypothetical protein